MNFRRKLSGRKGSNFGENWTKQQEKTQFFVEKSMSAFRQVPYKEVQVQMSDYSAPRASGPVLTSK